MMNTVDEADCLDGESSINEKDDMKQKIVKEMFTEMKRKYETATVVVAAVENEKIMNTVDEADYLDGGSSMNAKRKMEDSGMDEVDELKEPEGKVVKVDKELEDIKFKFKVDKKRQDTKGSFHLKEKKKVAISRYEYPTYILLIQ